MRYVVIGPTPPPLGGVSVYIARVTRKLQAEGNTVENVDVAGARGFAKVVALGRLLLDPRPAQFDLHAFDFSAMAALLLRPFSKRVTYMDHGTPLYKRNLTGVRRWLLRRLFRTADELSFVSAEGKSYYEHAGYELTPNAAIQHAFLPPPLEDEARILATYPSTTLDFLDRKSPLLVGNASQIIFYNDVDLYGFDMCVELARRLAKRYPRVGFLFAIANDDANRPYVESLRKKLRDEGLSDSVELLTGQRELWPVFRRADLMIRPTSNDGYAISLEEAIFCGCRTLASDAARRPQGTTLFRSRDIDDLEAKTLGILNEAYADG